MAEKTSLWRPLGLLCLTAILISACGAPQPAPEAPKERQFSSIIQEVSDLAPETEETTDFAAAETTPLEPGTDKTAIVALLPLTGDNAAVGTALLNALSMALFDRLDPRIGLYPLNTASDPVVLERAMEKITDLKPVAIIGPLDGALTRQFVRQLDATLQTESEPGETLPTETAWQRPVVFSLTNDPRVAAADIYPFAISPETEVRHIIAHGTARGDRAFAALSPLGPYGDLINRSLGTALEESGAYLSQTERYARLADSLFDPVKVITQYDERKDALTNEVRFLRSLRDDMTDEIAADLEQREEIEKVPYDAVLIPEGGALLKTLSPLFPFYEVDSEDVHFYGTGLMNDPSLVNEPTLIGSRFAAPDPALTNRFNARYEETFGTPAFPLLHAAYDAMALTLFHLGEDPKAGVDRAALLNRDGFTGLTGLYRLLPSGRMERSLAIIEITTEGLLVVSPALSSFPQFGTPANGVFQPLDD